MSTLAEIEAAIAGLNFEELQHLERTVHGLYQQRGKGLIYDDRHGAESEEDMIAAADAAFLAYDRAEAERGPR